jgi:hypothetical protein
MATMSLVVEADIEVQGDGMLTLHIHVTNVSSLQQPVLSSGICGCASPNLLRSNWAVVICSLDMSRGCAFFHCDRDSALVMPANLPSRIHDET